MIERPLLKPWLRTSTENERVVFESDGFLTILEGAGVRALLPQLMPLLDGRQRTEIFAAFGERIRSAVENLLAVMERQELLLEAPFPEASSEAMRATLGFLAATAGYLPVAEAAERLAAERIGILGTGNTSRRIFEALSSSDAVAADRLGWADEIPETTFAVVAPSPAELPALAQWNTRALQARLSWLLVLPFDGRRWTLGPLFIPDDTCCYECFRMRRALNLEYWEEAIEARHGRAQMNDSGPMEPAIAGLASALTMRWLGLRDSTLPGVAHTLSFSPRLVLAAHDVLRVPRCVACSDLMRDARQSPWFPARA